MKVAFIGLGNMGGPMALNLHRAGFEVSGFDLSADVRDGLRSQGLPIAASVEQTVPDAEIVVSMLPASQHVEALFLGAGTAPGLLERIAPGALIIDSSTIAAETSRKVAQAGASRDIAVIDAPVSGGTAGAVAGTLTFMVGGAVEALERARPVLEAMGSTVFHAGEAGAGQTAKICNNMLLGILMIGSAEAIALGVANGLDPKVLSEIMRKSSGANWVLEKYNPLPGVMESAPASRNYAGGFGTALMLKDLELAQQSATSVRASTPLGGLARQLYASHALAGHGALDFSSIIKLFRSRD